MDILARTDVEGLHDPAIGRADILINLLVLFDLQLTAHRDKFL